MFYLFLPKFWDSEFLAKKKSIEKIERVNGRLETMNDAAIFPPKTLENWSSHTLTKEYGIIFEHWFRDPWLHSWECVFPTNKHEYFPNNIQWLKGAEKAPIFVAKGSSEA